MVWLYILLTVICMAKCLEVIPTKPEVVYVNQNFFKNFKVNVKRNGRGSPYVINIYMDIVSGLGDNTTFSFESFENIQGHYIPILFKMGHELCKFFDEPLIGRMIVNQLPKNLSTCPVPPGYYVLPNLQIHLENIPIRLPFTFGAVEIRARVDIKAHVTSSKELILYLIFHGRVIQKPRRNCN